MAQQQEFLKDFVIQLYSYNEEINLKEYKSKPTNMSQSMLFNLFPLAFGFTDESITQLTKRVNGGTNGLPDRIKHFKEYYNLLK